MGVSVLADDDKRAYPLNAGAKRRKAPGSTNALDMLLPPLNPPTCEPDQLVVCTGRACTGWATGLAAGFGRACTGISAANVGTASSESRDTPASKDRRIFSPHPFA